MQRLHLRDSQSHHAEAGADGQIVVFNLLISCRFDDLRLALTIVRAGSFFLVKGQITAKLTLSGSTQVRLLGDGDHPQFAV